MAAVAHAYQYLARSELRQGNTSSLHLATSNPGTDSSSHPHLYEGRFTAPRQAAALLSAVHLLVGSRFFTPANSVAKAIALADPVITIDGERLRFEGFSSCCSTYIRADFLPGGHEGDVLGKGTTNVDFNLPTRSALARVRDADGLALSIGHDAVHLASGRGQVVERKVDLPLRWLRGMVEVQSYLANMRATLCFSGIEAIQWFRHLPKGTTHHTPLWLSKVAGRLVSSTLEHPNGVRLSDARRLRVLEPLLPFTQRVTVYADAHQQASAWVLELPGARLTLALSAEPWRAFSGEGQALQALMHMQNHPKLPALRAQLHWQARLIATDLSERLDMPPQQIQQGLRVLGASGLLGFDLTEGCYFHRVLPFDLTALHDMHPRLASASELLESGGVSLHSLSPVTASVGRGDSVHAVREHDGQWRCTCPWYGKHQDERGPCKHVLAVEAALAKATASNKTH